MKYSKLLFPFLLFTNTTFAATLYESALDTGTQALSRGSSVSNQYLGSRFTLAQDSTVTGIGALFGNVNGDFWGAIISLNAAAIPGSTFDIETEALGFTIFNQGDWTVDDTYIEDLSLSLMAGDYAVVFGGDTLFGTTGSANTHPQNQADTSAGVGSYFFKHIEGSWFNGGFNNNRMVVMGEVSQVPVPAAIWLMGSGLLGLMRFSRKNKAQSVAA